MYTNQNELITEFAHGRATFGAAGRLIVYGDTLYSQSDKEEGLQMVAIRVGQNFFLMQQPRAARPDNRSYVRSVFKKLTNDTNVGFDHQLEHAVFFVNRWIDEVSHVQPENPSLYVKLDTSSLNFVQDQLEHAVSHSAWSRVDQARIKSWLQQFEAWRKKYDWQMAVNAIRQTADLSNVVREMIENKKASKKQIENLIETKQHLEKTIDTLDNYLQLSLMIKESE